MTTKTETAVATVQNVSAHPAPISIDRMALAFAQSGFFKDANDAAKALVKIQFGMEMGIGPAASMSGVHIIEGKPVMGANLMAASLKRGGKYNYRVLAHDDEECIIEFYEAGKPVGKSSFSMEDARKARLADRPVWKSYGRNMLFSRAISNGIRWYAPDIFGGATVYTPEELETDLPVVEKKEVPPQAPVIDAVVVEEAPAPAPAPKAKLDPKYKAQSSFLHAKMKEFKVPVKDLKEWSSSRLGKDSSTEWNDQDWRDAIDWVLMQDPTGKGGE